MSASEPELVRFCQHCEESMWWVTGAWLCGECDAVAHERPSWMHCYDDDDDDFDDDDVDMDDEIIIVSTDELPDEPYESGT